MVSIFNNFIMAVFKPRKFFTERFSLLSHFNIQVLGFLGVFFGLIIGNLITYGLSVLVSKDFLLHPEIYIDALKNLNIEQVKFVELLTIQKAYALLLILLSPLIAYMASHLFGGALFAMLWLLMPQEREKWKLHGIMDISSIALCSMLFYIIPVIGPLIAVVMVAVNVSLGIRIVHKVAGFIKTSCVIIAIYVCFFLSAASLQLLAQPFAQLFK